MVSEPSSSPLEIINFTKIDSEHFLFRGIIRTDSDSGYQEVEVKMSIHRQYPLAPDQEAYEGQLVIQLNATIWLLFEPYWLSTINQANPIGSNPVLSVMDLYNKLTMFGFNRNNNSVIMMTLSGLFMRL